MKAVFETTASSVMCQLAAAELAQTASGMSQIMEYSTEEKRWFFLLIMIGLTARLGPITKSEPTEAYIRGQMYSVATEIESIMEDLREMVARLAKGEVL